MTRTTRAAVEISSAIGLVFCIVGTASAADQIPNIRGKWVGKTHSIVAGVAPHWPSNRGTFERLYCGPVLRHPAGPIQAANFRSAIAF